MVDFGGTAGWAGGCRRDGKAAVMAFVGVAFLMKGKGDIAIFTLDRFAAGGTHRKVGKSSAVEKHDSLFIAGHGFSEGGQEFL